MNRHEFSMMLCEMLQAMTAQGLKPFIDYVKRSTEEQQRMFHANLSMLDGINKTSQHQFGKAADLYFLDDQGKLADFNRDEIDKWHDWWKQHGGADEIVWDLGHFEVK